MAKSSSIESEFQFLTYKIDTIDFKLEPNSRALLYTQNGCDNSAITIGFAVRDVSKVTQDTQRQYMCGLEVQVIIKDKDSHKIAQGNFGIEGLFLVKEQNDYDQEEKMVKYQFTTILFPYLRSAITNILASAGFGSVIVPLINVYSLVDRQDKKNQIQIIEMSKD